MVRTKKQTRYRGLATVEVAIVFPLLLLLTFGAIKYGWLFLKAQQITNAARHGARIAILPGKTTDEVELMIINLLGDVGITISADNVDFDPPDISSVSAGDTVTVQVTVPGANVDIMDVPLLPQVGNLGASVTMAKEGPFEVIPDPWPDPL